MATIPNRSPSDLTPKSYALYRLLLNATFPSEQTISDSEIGSASEIVDAGLGRLDDFGKDTTLRVRNVSEDIIFADSERPRNDDTSPTLVATITDTRGSGTLVAVLRGASVRFTTERNIPVARLQVAHHSGRDVEHDPAYLARLTILAPAMQSINSTSTVFSGFLTESYLYPTGADPKMDGDDDILRGGETCNDCSSPHPIMPYLPPAHDLINIPVEVSIYHQ